MNVYIVYTHCIHEEEKIMGIYSSSEKANKRINEINRHPKYRFDNIYYSVYHLDEDIG